MGCSFAPAWSSIPENSLRNWKIPQPRAWVDRENCRFGRVLYLHCPLWTVWQTEVLYQLDRKVVRIPTIYLICAQELIELLCCDSTGVESVIWGVTFCCAIYAAEEILCYQRSPPLRPAPGSNKGRNVYGPPPWQPLEVKSSQRWKRQLIPEMQDKLAKVGLFYGKVLSLSLSKHAREWVSEWMAVRAKSIVTKVQYFSDNVIISANCDNIISCIISDFILNVGFPSILIYLIYLINTVHATLEPFGRR